MKFVFVFFLQYYYSFALGLVFLRLATGSILQFHTYQGICAMGDAFRRVPGLKVTDLHPFLKETSVFSRIIRNMLNPDPTTRW